MCNKGIEEKQKTGSTENWVARGSVRPNPRKEFIK